MSDDRPTKLSYDDMVAEELPIQRVSLAMEWPKGFPTCGKLFGRYVDCKRFKAQFNSYHQFGELRPCDRYMDDIKFCLTQRSESEQDKRDAWALRRAEWFARRRQGPSAEDVYEVRSYPKAQAQV